MGDKGSQSPQHLACVPPAGMARPFCCVWSLWRERAAGPGRRMGKRRADVVRMPAAENLSWRHQQSARDIALGGARRRVYAWRNMPVRTWNRLSLCAPTRLCLMIAISSNS